MPQLAALAPAPHRSQNRELPADLILFDAGSDAIAKRFQSLLDLGLMLLTENPTVTIDVIGHSASLETAGDGLDLARARVNAVMNYWVEAGIDPSRVSAIGRGRAEPVISDSASIDQENSRRVEFIISGLLG